MSRRIYDILLFFCCCFCCWLFVLTAKLFVALMSNSRCSCSCCGCCHFVAAIVVEHWHLQQSRTNLQRKNNQKTCLSIALLVRSACWVKLKCIGRSLGALPISFRTPSRSSDSLRFNNFKAVECCLLHIELVSWPQEPMDWFDIFRKCWIFAYNSCICIAFLQIVYVYSYVCTYRSILRAGHVFGKQHWIKLRKRKFRTLRARQLQKFRQNCSVTQCLQQQLSAILYKYAST